MLAKTTPHNLVKFVTWNCKGLNGTIKRCNILAHLKKLDMDICFLQETHLKNQDHNRLRNGLDRYFTLTSVQRVGVQQY
ncbi:MAG: endonuclease/exonuclease/phosphatase family protein [Cetobacterium sp.]